MLPAILALGLHNAGIVASLMSRHAEAIPYRADAPRGPRSRAYETVPRLDGQILAYLLYRWELILRESAIFGIPGSRRWASPSMRRSRSCASTWPCCGSPPPLW
ncbi:hypothetical protein [Methylobacterium sp. PvR107]|uniref:hypothetical protein n=1 Tax=Methylobacterium sp. PvR107 TaxID=2806597 RepID=UPI001B487060|nr:hypothetical protein [Methylobacterium sp. PvR107]MBP1183937.1 ABC-type phosphate/phosphonate transport system permease subunit [Methylobacterium sp. PvR107]